VQALPSLQMLPFGLAGFVQAPVAMSHAPARWQSSVAVQTTGLPPVHTPFKQASARVQALPSSQVVPSALGAAWHWPVAGLQRAGSWQASLAGHVRTAPPVQAPARQTSSVLHGLPSSQLAPSALGGFVHAPVVESQVPGS
jgi:hypothetical protein